jgi:hypothetical protein
MADIRSAREIARQKISNLGEPTEDDRLRWKYIPEGEKLAVECLKRKVDINKILSGFEEKAGKYVKKGMEGVLLANINLPRNETKNKNNEIIIDCLRCIKKEKTALESLIDSLRQLFEHYSGQGEQQRKQAYESLKAEYGQKLRQAVKNQLGAAYDMEIEVENLPQFQQEWQQKLAQLDAQYIKILDEYKQQLKTID